MNEVYDKEIGTFRIIAIEYTADDIENLIHKAKENVKNLIDNMENSAAYIGSEKDVAIGRILAKHLRKKLKYPFLDCEAHEEGSYNLPEFSIFYNQDARSFCGRWTYSKDLQTLNESGVFFALILSLIHI